MKECRFCKKEFEGKHFNQFYCSKFCKWRGKRLSQEKHKKSEKGKISNQKWIQSDRRKSNEKRYRQNPRVRYLLYLGNLRYKKNHPERYKELTQKYTQKYYQTERGKESRNRAARNYRKTDKYKIVNKNTKARRRNAFGNYTLEEWEQKLREFSYRCANHLCRKITKLTADHIIPIVKGGNNSIKNIQPLCQPCNSKKGIKVIKY